VTILADESGAMPTPTPTPAPTPSMNVYNVLVSGGTESDRDTFTDYLRTLPAGYTVEVAGSPSESSIAYRVTMRGPIRLLTSDISNNSIDLPYTLAYEFISDDSLNLRIEAPPTVPPEATPLPEFPATTTTVQAAVIGVPSPATTPVTDPTTRPAAQPLSSPEDDNTS